jgi:transcriptional regulator with GAF, ATPase, and Fis domain
LRVLERLECAASAETRCQVDVRLIAATNRSRLRSPRTACRGPVLPTGGVSDQLPPLLRAPTIPMLVAHFRKSLPSRGRTLGVVPEQVVRGFQERSWPGNVRELDHAVARVLSVGSSPDSQPPRSAVMAGLVGAHATAEARRLLISDSGEIPTAFYWADRRQLALPPNNWRESKFIQRAVKRYRLRGDKAETARSLRSMRGQLRPIASLGSSAVAGFGCRRSGVLFDFAGRSPEVADVQVPRQPRARRFGSAHGAPGCAWTT